MTTDKIKKDETSGMEYKKEILKKFSLEEGNEEINPVFIALEAALDKKAVEPVVIKLKDVTIISDYFIILTGLSIAQNKAIAGAIEKEIKEKTDRKKSHIEGYETGNWILLDYIDFTVHIFLPEKREFYDLEGLWGDAPTVKIEETIG